MSSSSLPDVSPNDNNQSKGEDDTEENENANNEEKKEIHINELLAYVSYYIHNSSISNIKRIALNFYSPEDIVNAKKLLWNNYKEHLDKYIDRRSTDNRTCDEANLEDIFKALQQLDAKSKLPVFVARDMEKIPDRQPEELNLCSIINRVSQIEKKMKDHIDTAISLQDIANETRNAAKLNKEMLQEHDDLIKKLFTLNSENMFVLENDDFLCKIKKIVNDEIKEQENLQLMTAEKDIPIKNKILSEKSSHELPDNNSETRMNDNAEVLDKDILMRFNRLKYFDDDDVSINNDLNDNSLNLHQFENFLDSKSQLNEKNASYEQRDKYSDITKKFTPNKIKENKFRSFNGPKIVVKNDPRIFQPRKIDEDGYHLYESRSALRKRRITEYSKYNLKGAPIAKVDIFVYKVTKGNCNDVKCILEDKGVDVDEVTVKSNNDARYRSFKVKIKRNDLKLVLDRNFWPQGVGCKIWKDFDKKTHKSISFVGSKYK